MSASEQNTSSRGVAIIEDSAMLGEFIEEAIESHPLLHVVGRVRTARAADTDIPWAQTDLASIDLHLPDEPGVALARRIRTSYPRIRILILSDHRRPALLSALAPEDVPYWSYALKSSIENRQALANIIFQSTQGPYVDPGLHVSGSGAQQAIASLSAQQRRILDLIARGHSNAAIAQALNVTDKAVEYHVKQVYSALELPPAGEANQRVLAAVTYLQQHAPDRHV